MTSHELARKLLSMPDVMVTVSGYEGGKHEISTISEPAELALNVNDEWYYGPHEYTANYEPYEGKTKVIAIQIG